MKNTSTIEVATVIGRFEPYHLGHANLVTQGLESFAHVIVVLGSAFHAINSKNPFTWQERATMISNTLAPGDKNRVSFIPVRDYYDDDQWAAVVSAKVEASANKQFGEHVRISLIGHVKDKSSDYLNNFKRWPFISLDKLSDIHATNIRRILFESENIELALNCIAEFVHPATAHFIKQWAALPHFPTLKEEYAVLQKEKKSWSTSPYPPIFSTVDAVVRSFEHVLLIKRGAQPGKGLWALPGGFLEQHERLLQGAIRELIEETRITESAADLMDAVVDVKVFDHPARSLRGRTITHAYFFNLNNKVQPVIEGADDASSAAWVAINELVKMEDMFFDDHFHILNQFLNLPIE
jgi:bifunctional NMN adenylyltransferase/nudix hydrolase